MATQIVPKSTLSTNAKIAIATILSILATAGVITGTGISDSAKNQYLCESTMLSFDCLGGLSTANSAGISSRCYLTSDRTSNYKTCSGGWIKLSKWVADNTEIALEKETEVTINGNLISQIKGIDGQIWKCTNEKQMKTDGTLDFYFTKSDSDCVSPSGEHKPFGRITQIEIYGG